MKFKKSKESAEEKSYVRPADRLYFWKKDICRINYGFMRLLATMQLRRNFEYKS